VLLFGVSLDISEAQVKDVSRHENKKTPSKLRVKYGSNKIQVLWF
jgi:hypothetical protein